jgi:uncharacterized membrane protein YhiD involved in acid resistance
MNTVDFLLRLGCALLCGALIGAERQWRQRTAGLRTYTLVAVGSALFVIVGCLIPDPSATRIASYVVSGVGFLGAGVIMRSGLNIRGINTAATIWCSSPLGTLSGFGYFKFACLGAVCVLGVNTLLRPVVALINRQPLDVSEQEFKCALYLTCMGRQEAPLRTYADAVDSPVRPAVVAAPNYCLNYGFWLNTEYELTKGVGAFVRLGWNAGQVQDWAYADVSQSGSAGLSIKGDFWHRPNDTFGLAGVINGISRVQQQFFADGGLGILAGDGALN